MFSITLTIHLFLFQFIIRSEISKRLVDYSFSSDEDGNGELLPNKISKLDEGRPILPNILPTTPWEVENEWVISDQWPPLDEASFSSAASTNLVVAPVIHQSGTHLDQGYMVGAGKKDKVEFKEGECRRIFKGAVYCRSFLPTKKANDLSSTLDSIKQILVDDARRLVEEHHGIKTWVGISNLYYSMKNDEEFEQSYESTNHYMTNEWEIQSNLETIMQYLYDRNSVIIKDTSQSPVSAYTISHSESGPI